MVNCFITGTDETTGLNNQSTKLKSTDEKIGKIVNNLKNLKKDKRKDEFERVYNVIDKLEKVGIKDNTYLSGDFDDDKWESDFFYSDDDEDFRDDR